MALVYLLAGEHSGDVLGARLMAALKARRPSLQFCGIGGPLMTAQGLKSLFPMQELAVMGLLEVLPRIFSLRRRLDETAADIAQRRPDVVVTIDSPGFALRVLRAITPLRLPRIHYVAPQVWAWREKRVKKFPGLWESLLCLLPFEPAFFARHGLAARFVGHPVLESGADQGDGARFRTRHGIGGDAVILVLMPGSRGSEVRRLLPIFSAALALLSARVANVVPVLPVAHAVAGLVREAVAFWPIAPLVVDDIADKHDAFAAAGAALTKSGTSTLELALAGVPMAVTYRVNPITAAIARRLIRVPHVAMVNLLAGSKIVPELLQQDCTPQRLADTLAELLTSQTQAARQRAAFADLLARLRPACGLPSEAAADAVLHFLP
jgi:lipid-A-disaccharide synthase